MLSLYTQLLIGRRIPVGAWRTVNMLGLSEKQEKRHHDGCLEPYCSLRVWSIPSESTAVLRSSAGPDHPPNGQSSVQDKSAYGYTSTRFSCEFWEWRRAVQSIYCDVLVGVLLQAAFVIAKHVPSAGH